MATDGHMDPIPWDSGVDHGSAVLALSEDLMKCAEGLIMKPTISGQASQHNYLITDTFFCSKHIFTDDSMWYDCRDSLIE